MTKKEFIDEYMVITDCSRTKANEAINTFLYIIEQKLASRESIYFRNFGRFYLKPTPKRMGVNPNTLMPMTIKESIKICFSPSDTLKEKLK